MILIWGNWITNNASLIDSPYEIPQDTMLFPKRLLEICMHFHLNIYRNYSCESDSWICRCGAGHYVTSYIRLQGYLLLSSKLAHWLEFLDVPLSKLWVRSLLYSDCFCHFHIPGILNKFIAYEEMFLPPGWQCSCSIDWRLRTPAPVKKVFSFFRFEAEALLSKINTHVSVIDLFQGFD